MRRVFAVALVVLVVFLPTDALAAAPETQAPSSLTNQDILKMVQAGLGEAVVLATVRTATATSFDLSPDGLIDRLSGGIYRVTSAQPLEPGEYCFFYAGGVNTIGFGPGAAIGRLFDFGISEAAATR